MVSAFNLITQYMYASSEKRPIVDETTRGKSIMYTKNNIEFKTDPCGTPDVTWATENIAPSTAARWV